MFENNTISKAQAAIKDALKERISNLFPEFSEREISSKSAKLLKIHGLDKGSFDFIKNIESFFENKLNDVSIDDNSNKNEKTIKGILKENTLSVDKIIGYRYLYRKMVELYGKEEAKRLSGMMYSLELGLSDSSNILVPYCWSMDASKLTTIGRDFGQLQSKPTKRVSSYVSALCETIHQMSNHLAGAIAIGSFFIDIAHIWLEKEGRETKDLLCKVNRKSIENEFQQFIHSVNHLSRNGCESPFTNVSIFEEVKLKALLADYEWYFYDFLNNRSGTIDEVIECIIELQKIYLELFDKGNPSKNGAPYRFPVTTLNLSKKEGRLISSEFSEYMYDMDIMKYNIFTSEGTKIASCCRLINDTEMMDFASQSNSFGGGGAISLGSHRVVTINLNRIANYSYNMLKTSVEMHIASAMKILKAHKELIRDMADKGLQLFISKGWINMDRMFSTIGILGLSEMEETAKRFGRIEEGVDFKEDILLFINEKVKEYSKMYGLIGNIEQIPAESFAVRLANADKIIFGEERIPYKMYSNQFVPLWENKTIFERMKQDGKYNSLITGGGIVHITVGENITKAQKKAIIKYAVDCGCEHFAINGVYSEFPSEVVLGDYDIHPTTGEKVIEKYTRIVGFFTPVSSWNKTRREWEFPKRVVHKNDDFTPGINGEKMYITFNEDYN